jgi:hypothetical protein
MMQAVDDAIPITARKVDSRNSSTVDSKHFCTVNVVEAKDIVKADATGKSDPYVKFSIGAVCDKNFHWGGINTKTLFKTNFQQQTLNPKWNEKFKFNIKQLSQQILSNLYPLHVIIELWDHDQIVTNGCHIDFNPADDLIGYARIPLHYFLATGSNDNTTDVVKITEWFSLFLPRTIKEEDVETDHVEENHNTAYAGKILLEFQAPYILEDDDNREVLSLFSNYEKLNEKNLNILHLKTITENNAYLKLVSILYYPSY